MSHVVASNLAYAHPGGELLFSEVSFKIAPGQHVGLVGANGVGKSTLFRVLAGLLPAEEGDVDVGPYAYMAQDVGVGAGSGGTIRELLLEPAPARLRSAGSVSVTTTLCVPLIFSPMRRAAAETSGHSRTFGHFLTRSS